MTLIERVPSFIRRDFPRKAISVFFGILLYWKVSMQIQSEEVIDDVRLNIVPPANMAVLGDEQVPIKVIVRNSGHKSLLNLSPGDFKFTIEVPQREKNAKPGEKTRTFKIMEIARITKPIGVEVLDTRPDSVSITLEEKASKEVPVKPRFTGATSPNYRINENVDITPPKLVLSGPKSFIEKINEVFTEHIVLDEKTVEDFETAVKISIPPGSSSSVHKVTALVEVQKRSETRRFNGLPIDVLCPASSGLKAGKIQPTNIDAIIEGPRNVIEMLSDKEIRPFVDLSSFSKAGTVTIRPSCFVDVQGAKAVSFSPEEVVLELMESK